MQDNTLSDLDNTHAELFNEDEDLDYIDGFDQDTNSRNVLAGTTNYLELKNFQGNSNLSSANYSK